MQAHKLAYQEVPSKALDIANNFPAPKLQEVLKRWPSASAMQINQRLVKGIAGLRPHEFFPGGSLGLLA